MTESRPSRLGVIVLGRQSDSGVTKVILPVSGWREKYGDGEFFLFHQRAGDPAAYPVVIEEVDQEIHWIVSGSDTALEGRGHLQLKFMDGDKKKNDVIYTTDVLPSLSDDNEDPPDPWVPWTSQVAGYAQNAQAAKSAAESAKAAAESAKTAAESARDDLLNARETEEETQTIIDDYEEEINDA